MFDVLLPTSNVDDRLMGTLNSIMASTRLPSRLIVVLDGATATPSFIRWRKSERKTDVQIVQLSMRAGVSGALRAGQSRVTSSYVARCDAGDIVDPRRFELQENALTHNKKLVAVGVKSKLLLLRPSGGISTRITASLSVDQARRVLPLKNPFVHGSLMFRTAAFQLAGGYDEKFPTSQDYDLLLRLSGLGDLAIINEILHTHVFSQAKSSTFVQASVQLRMSVRAKLRHCRRSPDCLSPAFAAYLIRDCLLACLPSGVVGHMKELRFRRSATDDAVAIART
jgi:hypothetical protein